MARRIYKKAKAVTISFYDHYTVEGIPDNPVMFDIRGWIWAEDKVYYYVSLMVIDGQPAHDQSMQFAVLKSAVQKITK